MSISSDNPLISVLLPVYNGEKYVKLALDSLLNQTYENIEILAINDGSTDRSEEIIQSYDDPRIRYIKNEKNLKLIKTLNKGIELANGEYIARLDADDISLPNRFEVQMSYLKEHPEVYLLGSNKIIIDADGNEISKSNFGMDHEKILFRMLFNNVYVHSSIIGKTSMFKEMPYDEGYYVAEDYHLFLQFTLKHKTHNLNDFLVLYRAHDESENYVHFEQQGKTVRRIYGEYFDHFGIKTNESELIYHNMFSIPKNVRNISFEDAKGVHDWSIRLEKELKEKTSFNHQMIENEMKKRWYGFMLFFATRSPKKLMTAMQFERSKALNFSKKAFILFSSVVYRTVSLIIGEDRFYNLLKKSWLRKLVYRLS